MKGFRTFLFNTFAAILPILEGLQITDYLNDEWSAAYIALVTAGNVYLRSKTDTKIFTK